MKQVGFRPSYMEDTEIEKVQNQEQTQAIGLGALSALLGQQSLSSSHQALRAEIEGIANHIISNEFTQKTEDEKLAFIRTLMTKISLEVELDLKNKMLMGR
jgi:hypothetical protein